VRRDDEIVFIELEIAHRRHRQVELEPLPAVAVVERYEGTALRSRDEQSAPFGSSFTTCT
jgi:hypothetical protein